MEIKKPIRVNESIQLEDGDGSILTTPMVWRSGLDHIRRQREFANYLCDLVNNDKVLTSRVTPDKIHSGIKKK